MSKNAFVTGFFLGIGITGLRGSSHSVWVFLGALLWCTIFEYLYHSRLQHGAGAIMRGHQVHHSSFESPSDCAHTDCVNHLEFGGAWFYVVILFVANGAAVFLIDLLFNVRWLAPSMIVFTLYFQALEVFHYRIHLGKWVPWGAQHHLRHHAFAPIVNFGVLCPLWDHVFGTKAR